MRKTLGAAGDRVDVSVIIVSWNTRDLLAGCIDSVLSQTTKPLEIIVVDNDSRDGTLEMLSRSYPSVIVIANKSNRGFAAANNQGLAISKGRYLLLLNPDTVILDHAIDIMVDWADGEQDVGCIGCQVLESEIQIQKTCFADPGLLSLLLVEFGLARLAPTSRLLAWPEYGYWNRTSGRDVDVVSGMFMLVPRRVFEAVGFLDEAFFIYGEEADWCRRIRKAGHRCVFIPIARIVHLDGGSKSTEQIRPAMYTQMQRSKLIYIRKHYGRLGLMLAKLIFISAMTARLVLFLPGAMTGSKGALARARLARTALRFHVLGDNAA